MQLAFQFQLLELLRHDVPLQKRVATAEIIEFQYRLFPAKVTLVGVTERYDNYWQRVPLLGFASIIFAAYLKLRSSTAYSYELPEANDELFFARRGDTVEFRTDMCATVTTFPFLDFARAATSFSEAALMEVVKTYPEIRKNREVTDWYPDRNSLIKLNFRT